MGSEDKDTDTPFFGGGHHSADSSTVHFDGHMVLDWANGNQFTLASVPFYMPPLFFGPQPQDQSLLQGALVPVRAVKL